MSAGFCLWADLLGHLHDTCLKKLNIMEEVYSVIAYADDIAIPIEGNSRNQIEDKIKTVSNELKLWCDKNKLTISADKTKHMVFKSRLIRNPTVKYENKNIARVKTFKYLGVIIDEKLSFSDHIEETTNKILIVRNKLLTLANTKFKLPLKLIGLYNNQIIKAIGTYGSSIWAHRLKENMKLAEKLDRAQRTILLRMSGAYRTTPGVALNVILGILPLNLEARKLAAYYWLKKNNLTKTTEILNQMPNSKEEIEEIIAKIWQSH